MQLRVIIIDISILIDIFVLKYFFMNLFFLLFLMKNIEYNPSIEP